MKQTSVTNEKCVILQHGIQIQHQVFYSTNFGMHDAQPTTIIVDEFYIEGTMQAK